MNHSSSLRRLLATAAAGVLLVAAHGTAHAADASTCAQGSRFDARLVALADRGVGDLRAFVIRTRTIHQLDMTEAMARVDRQRDACR